MALIKPLVAAILVVLAATAASTQCTPAPPAGSSVGPAVLPVPLLMCTLTHKWVRWHSFISTFAVTSLYADRYPAVTVRSDLIGSVPDPHDPHNYGRFMARGLVAKETSGDVCSFVFGPNWSSTATALATLIEVFWVDSSATATSLSSSQYSNLHRMIPTDKAAARGTVQAMRHFGWGTFHAVGADTSYGRSVLDGLGEAAGDMGLTIATSTLLLPGTAANRSVAAFLDKIAASPVRIVAIGVMPDDTDLYDAVIQGILTRGMESRYAFLFAEASCTTDDTDWLRLPGALCTTYRVDAALFEQLGTKLRAWLGDNTTAVPLEAQFNAIGVDPGLESATYKPAIYGAFDADTAHFAMAVLDAWARKQNVSNASVRFGGGSALPSVSDLKAIAQTTVVPDGITGPLSVDAAGDRRSVDFAVFNAQPPGPGETPPAGDPDPRKKGTIHMRKALLNIYPTTPSSSASSSTKRAVEQQAAASFGTVVQLIVPYWFTGAFSTTAPSDTVPASPAEASRTHLYIIAGALAIVVIAIALYVLYGLSRYRVFARCPVDPTTPFTAFFVSVKNEAVLNGFYGEAATYAACRSLETLVVRCAEQCGCHVARRLDAHFLVVSVCPLRAMRCIELIHSAARNCPCTTFAGVEREPRRKPRPSESLRSGSSTSRPHTPHTPSRHPPSPHTTHSTTNAGVSTSSAPRIRSPTPPSGVFSAPSEGKGSNDRPMATSLRDGRPRRYRMDHPVMLLVFGAAHGCGTIGGADRGVAGAEPGVAAVAGLSIRSDPRPTPSRSSARRSSFSRAGRSSVMSLLQAAFLPCTGPAPSDLWYAGPPVDTAARLADTAQPGQALATELLRQAVIEGAMATGESLPGAAAYEETEEDSAGLGNSSNSKGTGPPTEHLGVHAFHPAGTDVNPNTGTSRTVYTCSYRSLGRGSHAEGGGDAPHDHLPSTRVEPMAGALTAALEEAGGHLARRVVSIVALRVPLMLEGTPHVREDCVALIEEAAEEQRAVVLGFYDGVVLIGVNVAGHVVAQAALRAARVALAAAEAIGADHMGSVFAGIDLGPAFVGSAQDGARAVVGGHVVERAVLLARCAERNSITGGPSHRQSQQTDNAEGGPRPLVAPLVSGQPIDLCLVSAAAEAEVSYSYHTEAVDILMWKSVKHTASPLPSQPSLDIPLAVASATSPRQPADAEGEAQTAGPTSAAGALSPKEQKSPPSRAAAVSHAVGPAFALRGEVSSQSNSDEWMYHLSSAVTTDPYASSNMIVALLVDCDHAAVAAHLAKHKDQEQLQVGAFLFESIGRCPGPDFAAKLEVYAQHRSNAATAAFPSAFSAGSIGIYHSVSSTQLGASTNRFVFPLQSPGASVGHDPSSSTTTRHDQPSGAVLRPILMVTEDDPGTASRSSGESGGIRQAGLPGQAPSEGDSAALSATAAPTAAPTAEHGGAERRAGSVGPLSHGLLGHLQPYGEDHGDHPGDHGSARPSFHEAMPAESTTTRMFQSASRPAHHSLVTTAAQSMVEPPHGTTASATAGRPEDTPVSEGSPLVSPDTAPERSPADERDLPSTVSGSSSARSGRARGALPPLSRRPEAPVAGPEQDPQTNSSPGATASVGEVFSPSEQLTAGPVQL